MSDLIRNSSPLSSSPGRSDSFERPTWPWQSRYSRRASSSPSASSPASGLQTAWPGDSTARPNSSTSSQTGSFSASGSSWQSNPTLRQHTGSTMGYAVQEESGTRQWSFFGFEWVVRDVRKLRDFVEDIEPENREDEQRSAIDPHDFEVLKHSPMIGDDKFKLEIARLSTEGETRADNKCPTLSVSITSLILDFAHHYEMNASIMAAIKCPDDRVGARPEWIWEFWENDWVFRRENEVWDCALPSLSALLDSSETMREADSFTLCIQIHCPTGPFFPQQPTAYYVPRELLDGLEASLDNPNTGDVRFVTLERMPPDAESPSTPISEVTASSSARRPPSSTSSHSPFTTQTTARKRVIYAHSDILSRRSEYFSNILSSSFAETKLIPGDRKLYTIVVEEADFETIYWLLKFCYANWLSFKEHDDPRLAVEGIGAGWSARWLSVRGGEWDWKTYAKSTGDDSTMADARSATSAESVPKDASPTSTKGKSVVVDSPSVTSPTRSSPQSSRAPAKVVSNSASTSRQTPSTVRRPIGSSASTSTAMSSGISRTKPVPLSAGPAAFPSSGHYPISPRTQRPHQSTLSTPDPHPHPTPAPPPASALSIYQVAHRYMMPTLAALALDHMMSTITPQSSFGLLLATSVWDELHTLVEVEKWEEVSVSDEFEQCCQEAVKTLMALFRRLRSPSNLGYSRT
ncbi:hypothetical protein B0H15DRAFT_829907 [Mycena belliarum]|uniref:BTB domain-containing protein n=1 Tax=Mycena belliarum TaxID=1033014 RepID=A0AAD6XPU2_9AGAR|nr:hypothetical protein B0H15DRAFT_829907 [Mycena belliae]